MLDFNFSLSQNINYKLRFLKLPNLGCITFHFLFGPINAAVCNSAFACDITEKRSKSGLQNKRPVSCFYGRLSNTNKASDLRERSIRYLNVFGII